jgi:hypothetical protein
MSAGLQRAFTEDTVMLQKYGAIAGEKPRFTPRDVGQEATAFNEKLYEGSGDIVASEKERLLTKYFSQYLSK